MKRLLKIGLIFIASYLFIGYHSIAQNNISNYQYWFDNDFSSQVYTTVTPTENLELHAAISLETLSDGLHVFNIRFRDEQERWSTTSSDFFYYNELSDNTIIAYQYWFDNNLDTQTTESVSQTAQLQLQTSIAIDALKDGLHLFSIRFKDDKGRWSAPQNQFFYYNQLTDSNIISYQYWFDNDLDTQATESVSPTGFLQLQTAIVLESMGDGLHLFSIRFKDNKGRWSVPQNQFFYYNRLTDSEIVAYQYWFDDAIENQTQVWVTPKRHLQFTEIISISDIDLGLHLFSIRFKDTTGKWSVPVNQFIYKMNPVVDNTITGYRYWINDAFENAVYVPIDSPLEVLKLNEDINFPVLAVGDYTIHFQFKDLSDRWSIVTSDDFTLTTLSVIETNFEKSITAYPNPTKQSVYIDLSTVFNGTVLKVFDATGQLLQQESYNNQQSFKLNLNAYSNGVYYIMIIADGKKATLRFIKY